MNVVYVNGFAYMQPVPFDAPGPDGERSPEYLGAEIGRRTGLAAAAFEQRIWRDVLQRWDDEFKPAAIARHREFAEIDLASLDDDALLDQLRQRIQWLTDMAYQHHRFNATAMLPIGDFILHAVQWTGARAGADVRCLRRMVAGVRGGAARAGARDRRHAGRPRGAGSAHR